MIRKLIPFAIVLLASTLAFADPAPHKLTYVGSISINPSQDAKVLADWYSRFGITTKEYGGGYYGKFDTAAGLFVFGIHPKKAGAPAKSSGSISIVFAVENFEASLSSLKSKNIVPTSTEKDATGQFAHFLDPDGNEVTIWGKPS